MQIKNGKDFWAGAMFLAFGLSFMIVGMNNYAMGNAVRMGPAYFPAVLGGMLATLGAIIFARAFFSKISHPLKSFAFRPATFFIGVAISTVTFFVKPMVPGIIGDLFVAISLIVITAAFGPRSLWVILGAVVVFAFLLKPFGMVIATLGLTYISAWGGNEFKRKEVLILYVVLILFAVIVFVHGLGLPFNICPEIMDDACRKLGISK
jgi:hypothetical protein